LLPFRPTTALPAREEIASGWCVLAGLLALCLLPRIIMAWRLPGICPDAAFYIGLANAFEHGTYLESSGQVRFNLYPIILSSIHRLGLSWETAGLVWGVGISSCTVLPLFGWIRRAFSREVAIAAGIMYAIHSGLIRWSAEIIRDSTFWFLFTLSLYLLWRAAQEMRWTWYLAAGTAIALACLTRFEGLVLFVPLLGWSWWSGGQGHIPGHRLAAKVLLCASIYPLSLLMVNSLWFHGPTSELVRTKPVELVQDWAQESVTGQRPVEQQGRSYLLAPLPWWKMIARLATGMFRGFTPLYLLAIAVGIASGSKRFVTSPYQALALASGLILAAIWVHLYWSHEAGPRYFFPIVIMTAPLAGWGLLQLSAFAQRVRGQFSPRTAWLAGAAPLALMLLMNMFLAFGGDFENRSLALRLGRWTQTHYGPAAKMLGPDGITQVATFYAQGQCESFPQNASPAEVLIEMERLRPNIVLLSTDGSSSPADPLKDRLAAEGFETVDKASLPAGCEKLRMLVRHDEESRTKKPRLVNRYLSAAAERPVRVSFEGGKPRS
jgi:hypothetical protein